MQLPWHRRKKSDQRAPRRITIRLQWVYLTIMSGLTIVIGAAIYGTYALLDRTLTSSEVVIRLRQEVSDESFRADVYQQAVETMQGKVRIAEPTDWLAVPNPFGAYRPPALPISTPPPLPTATPPPKKSPLN